ncbi:MAG TPA: UPF0175 family protein [Phycisphaerae bacterium]|nr:UPF0175 family protein [Phycisphaerae bacterium]
MSLTITLQFPPEVEASLRAQNPNIESQLTEAVAVELFRRGQLSHYELSKVLHLDRFETDAYLQRHKIYEGSLTMEDLDEEARALDRLLGPVRPK